MWYRRLGELDTHSLEMTTKKSGNGVALDGSIADCDVCAVEKSHQLAHPKNTEHATISPPFQLVCGDRMGPFNPTGQGGTRLSATSRTISPSGPQSTFSAVNIRPLPRFC